jgi:hypothetical protein
MPEAASDFDNRVSGLTCYMQDESREFRFELAEEPPHLVVITQEAKARIQATTSVPIRLVEGRSGGAERLYGRVAAWLFAAAFALSTVCAVITTLQSRDFSADEVNGPSIQFLGKAQ